MRRSVSDFSRIQVWCDKESDARLMRGLKSLSRAMSTINDIRVLPRNRAAGALFADGLEVIWPLVQYDRPDLIFCHQGRPFLIAELTEHGYTGDNPLQRFSRIACAAEGGIPLIYFAPFARTRYDEVELTDEETSPRRVSARLYQGFVRLAEIYEVPIVAVGWPVNERGLPLKPLTAGSPESVKVRLREIFGSFIILVEKFISMHLGGAAVAEIALSPELAPHIEKTRQLAAQGNTRQSDVRISGIPYEGVLALVEKPTSLFAHLPRDYFFKGKEQKLVALSCVQESIIRQVQAPDGNVVNRPHAPGALRRLLPTEFSGKPWTLLFSGYEWRSTPNNGILVNTDYILCRSARGRTPRDRDQFLVVVWPRVFLERQSTRRQALLEDLRQTVPSKTTISFQTHLGRLLRERRETRGVPLALPTQVGFNHDSIGIWNENASVARIYRQFADLIILNDAALLGNHWSRKMANRT